MIRRLAAILSATMLFNTAAVSAQVIKDDRTILYIATDGNDSNDGSKERPFATIKKARDEIRELKQKGELGKKGAVVYFRGGTYQLLEQTIFGAEDSGEENAPIVYRGYPGEDAKLIGGITIPTAGLKKTTDTALLDRVIDEKAKSNIYEVNLETLGLKEIPPTFISEVYGLWGMAGVTIDEEAARRLRNTLGMKGTLNAFELFVDNDVQSIARYPNIDEDYMTIKTSISNYWYREADRSTDDILMEQIYGNPSGTFSFIPSDVQRAKQWAGHDMSDVYMWIKVKHGWADESDLIKEVLADGTIVSAHASYWGPAKEGNPLYVYNFFDEISNKEYYIDYDTNTLYMCLDKKPEAIGNITMTTLENPMFNLDGTSNMQITNLHMSMTRGEVVKMKNCKNVAVDNCEVSYTSIAGKAVNIIDGCSDCGVKNSNFHDINGGVYIWTGDKETLTKANCYIVNCEFSDFARLKKTYNSAFHLEGCGNRAAYNKVHGAEHMAAGWGGNYNVIEFNEFYDVCTDTDDAAAIYAGRSLVPRGNVIRYNYFHEVGHYKNKTSNYGSHAIYLDDGYSSADVVGNVCENIANYGVFVGGGRDNVIFNNVVINSGGGVFCDARYSGLGGESDIRYAGLMEAENMWRNDIWKEAFPELYNIDLDTTGTPSGNIFENNVTYNSGSNNIYAEVADKGTVANNWITTSDPGFVDAENGNYLFKEDAEVYKKIQGFLPIPFTRMGMCTDRAITRARASTVITVDSPNALVGGTKTTIDDDESVKPTIRNNKTYVPLRFLAEACGFGVSYDNNTQTAEITNDADSFKINVKTGELSKNGEEKETLEPLTIGGRTMIPLRDVAEMLDKKVFWNDRGFIAISDYEDLFDNVSDDEIIDYLYNTLRIY